MCLFGEGNLRKIERHGVYGHGGANGYGVAFGQVQTGVPGRPVCGEDEYHHSLHV